MNQIQWFELFVSGPFVEPEELAVVASTPPVVVAVTWLVVVEPGVLAGDGATPAVVSYTLPASLLVEPAAGKG